MERILYLLKLNINKKIILKYILFILSSKLKKNQRKKYISNFRNFLKKKKITQDWFSHNVFDWYEEKDLIETKKDFLEIGSFEGISALYVLENYPNINLTCVDAWNAETDGNQNFNIKLVEKNFNTNIKKYKKRIKKIKNYSKVFFLQNKKKFDIIYVDGSHKAKDVFDDCVSSWKILKKNGLLILDDFFWKEYNDIKDNTAYGISKFLMLTKSFEIIKLSKYQLFIKKI